MLIKRRALSKKNSPQEQKLFEASLAGDHVEVEKLIKAGVDVNAKQEKTLWTPLHYAAVSQSVQTVKVLLKYRAGYYTDKDGFLALDIAKQRGNSKIAKVLIDHWEKLWDDV